LSSEITNKINSITTTFNNQFFALESIIPTLPINDTNVNYTNDNSVVKAVQMCLCEMDDNINILIDHVDDILAFLLTSISNPNKLY
jgi:hypothetical protein